MPPVFCKPQAGVPLCLYFAVTEWAISSVLVQAQDQVHKPIYFVSKALQGPETRYQSLEKAALAVVFSARTLRHYFHSFTVVVMTDLPIQKVLQKPDVAGRMVRWAMELLEFDIVYEPRGIYEGTDLCRLRHRALTRRRPTGSGTRYPVVVISRRILESVGKWRRESVGKLAPKRSPLAQ